MEGGETLNQEDEEEEAIWNPNFTFFGTNFSFGILSFGFMMTEVELVVLDGITLCFLTFSSSLLLLLVVVNVMHGVVVAEISSNSSNNSTVNRISKISKTYLRTGDLK